MSHHPRNTGPHRALAASFVLSWAGTGLAAETADLPAGPGTLQEILVIGTTPVPGLTMDIDKVPGNVQSVFSGDLGQNGAARLSSALESHLGSVSISDSLSDPFQPDVTYRGFEASPVLGTPQGLAVYQNGVRINEAFGDSVNWDFIPDVAINRVDIVSASPLYGLNALGGAMAVTMKNGFTHDGAGAELSGGSFNQRNASAEFGGHHGQFGLYAAARAFDEDGWRLFSHDAVRQYYLDASLHGEATTLELSYSRANNRLFGPGAAPVQSLAVDPAAVFTGPQANLNDLDFITLDASRTLAPDTALQAVGYFRNYRQYVSNGNAGNDTACTTPADAGFLCQSDATTPLTNAAGARLPTFPMAAPASSARTISNSFTRKPGAAHCSSPAARRGGGTTINSRRAPPSMRRTPISSPESRSA